LTDRSAEPLLAHRRKTGEQCVDRLGSRQRPLATERRGGRYRRFLRDWLHCAERRSAGENGGVDSQMRGGRPHEDAPAGIWGGALSAAVGLCAVNSPDINLLVVSEKGYGKRSDINDYRITNRGGKGVKTINITDKTGALVAIKEVTDKDELMIINKTGITIRIEVADLRVMGRATQGVRLIRLNEDDEISSVAKIERFGAINEDVKAEKPEGTILEGDVDPETGEEPGDDAPVSEE
ncbi:MAG: DNA gyrase C-terminal beta-propeller domain-containing protein, partial [Cytophagaceae bacterium]